MTYPAPRGLRSAVVLAILAAWLAAATALGAPGVTDSFRPPVPQLILATLTVVLFLAGFVYAPFRLWALALDPRAVVALHLTRLVAGGAFLLYYSWGELPYGFAVPGGWGDIAV